MIELDLNRLVGVLVQHLQVLAAVRRMCEENELPVEWCEEREREAGELCRAVRLVIERKGGYLQVH